jgi:type II secretory pathway pseudopilin PulG
MTHTKHIFGFTLIETLVAISVLVVSIAAPMSLVSQSLSSAFYARDQITAFYLAQEALEIVRAARDGNALAIARGESADLFEGIPDTGGDPFVVDAIDSAHTMTLCRTIVGYQTSGTCPPLQNNGSVYGYGKTLGYDTTGPWKDTRFTRTIRVTTVGSGTDEIKVSVTVEWRSGNLSRSFTIAENLYRWVPGDATII